MLKSCNHNQTDKNQLIKVHLMIIEKIPLQEDILTLLFKCMKLIL